MLLKNCMNKFWAQDKACLKFKKATSRDLRKASHGSSREVREMWSLDRESSLRSRRNKNRKIALLNLRGVKSTVNDNHPPISNISYESHKERYEEQINNQSEIVVVY